MKMYGKIAVVELLLYKLKNNKLNRLPQVQV